MKKEEYGYRVEGTVVSVKGTCSWEHKVGDKFQLGGHETDGLCGFFYHDIFPQIIMLQFGGGYPPDWGDPDVIEVACPDLTNTVKMVLRRLR